MNDEQANIMIVMSEKHARAFNEHVQRYEQEKKDAEKRQDYMVSQLEQKIRHVQICGGGIIIALLVIIGLLMWENWRLSDIMLQL